jgi:TRAP-type mannitol/chloroaromatic compound transport system substrate-binding protein
MEESMLNPNDRLTIPHAGHERKRTQYGYSAYWTQASKFDMMNRLGEYEDTGYLPEEIRAVLKALKEFTGEGHE